MAEHDKAVRRVPGDLRKETKAEVRVIRLPIERQGEPADFFARSFHTNPNFMDLFSDERARSLVGSQPAYVTLRASVTSTPRRGKPRAPPETSWPGWRCGCRRARSRSRRPDSFAPCRAWPA